LTRAAYDEGQRRWLLRFSNGKTVSARVLISGMGGLSRAAYPNVPGIENFKGKSFHSQNWDHDYPLEHKRVAVIGTGASAIQFVPQIAPRVASLALFQRTPPWIMPKPDRGITGLERLLFRAVPAAQRLMRNSIYWSLESRVLGFTITPKIMKLIQKVAVRHIHKQIDDPALREKVTPDYTIGCKRVLISNDYYPALARDNVEVVTTGIERIEENAVVTTDGVRHEVDALIFGTGFHATDPVPAGALFGRGGRDIADVWSNGAHAYLGSTLPEFPNFFMIVGPNTGLGHNSMVYMIESQVEYVLAALKGMRAAAAHAIEVRPDVEARYNEEIQQRLSRSIWNVGGCKSWYIDPRNGKNTTLWPGFTWRFRQQTSHFDMTDYHALRAPAAATPAAAQSAAQAV
jgi:cation diffusion facilitator CzcD-associated flavoprotein CzcO